MMWKFLLPAGVFAILVGFFFVGLSRDPSQVPSPLIGKVAPTYSLPRVEDTTQKVSSSDFAGKQHMVNVWATWCVECRKEHSVLLEIAKKNVVPIVGLDWKDELTSAQIWLAQLGNPYLATAFDEKGRVAIDFGVYGAPETFLIDAEGKVRYKHIGSLTMDVWEHEFLPRIDGRIK